MAYTLLGSLTSPFVRRVRLAMDNIPYDFKELNIYDNAEGAAYLHKINPVHQIPVLIDGEKSIWDSRVILQYLNEKHKLETQSWEKENLLTAIDGAINSGVVLFLSKRSGLSIDEPTMYFQRQRDRLESIMDYLKPHLQSPAAKEWNFVNMSLYAMIDWLSTRSMMNFSGRPECHHFLETHSQRPVVQLTQIPKT